MTGNMELMTLCLPADNIQLQYVTGMVWLVILRLKSEEILSVGGINI